MRPEDLKNTLSNLGHIAMLTEKRKYAIEASILFIISIILINWITPQANALYFLLLLPAVVLLLTALYVVGLIFENPERGLIVIAALLPFERIGALTYGSVNIRSSQVFFIITFLAYIGYYLIKNGKNFLSAIVIKRDISYIFLLIFAIVNIASLIVAPNVSRSLFVLASDIFIFFVYFFLSNLLTHKDILYKIIYAILLVSIVVSLFGIFQFFAGMLNLPGSISGLRQGYTSAVFGFPRVQAVESEPQFWGNYLLIPLSISAAIIVSSLTIKRSKLPGRIKRDVILASIAVFVLTLINILLTFSRGSWYASIAALAVIGIIYFRKIFTLKIIIAFIIFAFLSIGGFLIILQKTNAPLTLDIFTSRATAFDDSDRAITTASAQQYFASHKILGIGVGSFGPYEAPNIYQKPQAYGLDIGWRIVNNEYLEVATETGIIGIFTFTLFLLSVIYMIYKALKIKTDLYTNTILVGLTGAFAGILVQYIGFSTLYVMQVWVLFAIVDALAWSIIHNKWVYDS